MRRLTLWLACVVPLLLPGSASPHDASSYGGVFRSRDLGAAWLNADVGLFLNAALVIAVDPRDSSHLLVGTDLGILSSHNGGRSWVPEARDVIIGAVFALAFSPDGELAMCAAASGVFRRDQDGWLRAEAPRSAIPARALVAGPANDHFYLIGRNRLFASENAAAGGQIVVSDDLGSGWHSVGRSLPEAGTRVRGIAASADATTLLVSSDRGIYRSEDGGETWAPKENNLPTHIEAGPFARDPNDAGVIYAVFSLMPYAEVWRMAIEGGNLLARIEPISLVGGLSFCVLVLIGGGVAARHLSRQRAAAHSPR